MSLNNEIFEDLSSAILDFTGEKVSSENHIFYPDLETSDSYNWVVKSKVTEKTYLASYVHKHKTTSVRNLSAKGLLDIY